ncbi:MAG: Bug family tripartite tricarboxylate transporter substrate binding protein [Burkholderiales bacterium]
MSTQSRISHVIGRRNASRALMSVGLATLGLVALSSALAQSFPSRPVKVLLMFPPGGGSDSQARWIADKFRDITGQPLIVENRPGAGGIIAANAVKAGPADGYTLVHSNVAMMSLTPVLNPTSSFVEADFVPVASISVASPLFVARADFPVSNLKEFVARAKAKPGELAYGTWGPGSLPHVAGAWLESETSIKLNAVHYKGEVPLLTEMLGGQISLGWTSVSAAQPHIKDGKLKVIGVASDKRYPQFPQAPTFVEQGASDFVIVSWTGFHAPKGTPADIVARLNAVINEALRAPQVRDRIQDQGQFVVTQTSAQFAEFIKQNAARLRPILTKIGPSIRE